MKRILQKAVILTLCASSALAQSPSTACPSDTAERVRTSCLERLPASRTYTGYTNAPDYLFRDLGIVKGGATSEQIIHACTMDAPSIGNGAGTQIYGYVREIPTVRTVSVVLETSDGPSIRRDMDCLRPSLISGNYGDKWRHDKDFRAFHMQEYYIQYGAHPKHID